MLYTSTDLLIAASNTGVVVNDTATKHTVTYSNQHLFSLVLTAVLCLTIMAVLYIARHKIVRKIQSRAGTIFFPLFLACLAFGQSFYYERINLKESLSSGRVTESFYIDGPIFIAAAMMLLSGLAFTWYRDKIITKIEQKLSKQTETHQKELDALKLAGEQKLAKHKSENDLVVQQKDADLARSARIILAFQERKKSINRLVGKKLGRIQGGIDSDTKSVTPKMIETALHPESQIVSNLGALHLCMSVNGKEGDIRLILFVPNEAGDQLEYLASIDEKNMAISQNRILNNAQWFKIPSEHAKPCLAVYASQHPGIHIINDSESLTDEERQKFTLFYPEQSDHLRSAFAYQLKNDGESPHPVLMGYSSCVGAFSGDNYPMNILKEDVESFGFRLDFELMMLNFLRMGAGK